MRGTRILWNVISQKATPVSTVEFSNALSKIWSPHQGPDGQSATIGLAISGGVDSMALAVLCSQLQTSLVSSVWNGTREPRSQKEVLPDLKFQAFVVDHDVRAGSHLEAQAVSEVLEARGIPTEILKIRWPRTKNPNEKQGFESLARKYRFRILGKACRDLRINSLLLAHHEDDQAETVLMRMNAGHRLAGLIGIRERSEIPENYGMYGLHESGGDLFVPENEPPSSLKRGGKWDRHLKCESGGIQLYRPMLGFSKARLIATCEAEKMKWFEDPTNKDPGLTTRNAMRHMYANHKLPAALSKASLLSISEKVKGRLATRKAVVDRWLSRDKIRSFETRSGTLIIRFPHIKRLKSFENWPLSEKKQMAAELLRRILMLVTPEEHVEISSLHGAVARLFPEIESQDECVQMQSPTGFTVAGVQFQSVTSRSEFQEQHLESASVQQRRKPEWFLSRQPLPVASNRKHDSSPAAEVTGALASDEHLEISSAPDSKFHEPPITAPSKTVWSSVSSAKFVESGGEKGPHDPEVTLSVSLPPPNKNSPQAALIIPKYSTPKATGVYPLVEKQHLDSSAYELTTQSSKHPTIIHIPPTPSGVWSPWSLFDGRYWIRVQNPSPYPLHIKHFTHKHLSSLKNTLAKPPRQYMQDVLKKVAPGAVRWTLPVIVMRYRAWGWNEGEWLENVVGLPTLGVWGERTGHDSGMKEGVRVEELEAVSLKRINWEVRYKKLYLDGIPLAKELQPHSISAAGRAPAHVHQSARNKVELRCIACGALGHIEEACWKAHPELKHPAVKHININIEASHDPSITRDEGTTPAPPTHSSTKKKIMKRISWLKVLRGIKRGKERDMMEKRRNQGEEGREDAHVAMSKGDRGTRLRGGEQGRGKKK